MVFYQLHRIIEVLVVADVLMFQYIYFGATNIVEVAGIRTIRKRWRKSVKNMNKGGEETGRKGYQLGL